MMRAALLREGLRCDQRTATRCRLTPHKFGMRAGYDQTRLNQLIDELATNAWQKQQERVRK